MKRKAFTLIELLIVIAIIGVLAAALYPTIRGALASGRDGAREGDINNIITGLEVYNSTYGTYPDFDTGECVSNIFVDPEDSAVSVEKDIFKGEGAPKDPSPNRSLPAGVDDPGNCIDAGDYYYRFVNDNKIEYLIATVMENETKNNTDSDPTTYDGADELAEGDTYYIKLI